MQTKSYADAADDADADADGIHTKNNMSPTPSEGGHNETKKHRMSTEDRTIMNIAGLITPFLMVTKNAESSVKKLSVTVEKNKVNLRRLTYHHEKLEQYTRRDNLRMFNFPLCNDDELRAKFIEMAALLGVEVKSQDINIIHKLTANARSQSVIVRMNNRKLRNDILFAKKAPLNNEALGFKGLFIQEDLTNQRSKMLKFLKGNDNVERVQTSEGWLRVMLKEDKGAGKRVVIENPDDMFKIGLDTIDITQFGYIDV